MATDRQVAANRLNGLKGGPKTPEGKAVVRLNARKHGIFAQALTADDAEEAAGIYARMARWLRPVGEGEEGMVERLALIELRTLRCVEAEGEYFTASWSGDGNEAEVGLKGTVPWFNPEVYERLVRLFERYAQSLDKQYWRTVHEIRAEQKRRREEKEEDVVFAVVEDSETADAAEDAAPGCAAPAGAELRYETNRNPEGAQPVPGGGEQAPAPAEPRCETNPICQNMLIGNEIGDSAGTASDAVVGAMEAQGGPPAGAAGVIS